MNGKRLGSGEIRVNWANQRISRTTTASSRRPVTTSSALAPSGSKYSLHDSLTLLGESRNDRPFIDGGFLEGLEALDYSPDFVKLWSTGPSEGPFGSLLSDFVYSTLPHHKTHPSKGLFGTLLPDTEDITVIPDTRKTVASATRIEASQARRTRPARFSCALCAQTFTTNANLKNHVKVHQGIKDNLCRCMKGFTTPTALRRHLKTCKAPLEPMQQPSQHEDDSVMESVDRKSVV